MSLTRQGEQACPIPHCGEACLGGNVQPLTVDRLVRVGATHFTPGLGWSS